MIPPFDNRGFLPSGIHHCTADEFLQRFVSGRKRQEFFDPIKNIINYAANLHAAGILIGGSFVSDKKDPSDIDCVIVFRNEAQIPPVRDSIEVDSKRVDIFFASLDNKNILGSFLKLFQRNPFDEPVGVVEVVLNDSNGSHWEIDWYPDDDTYEIVKRVYLNRRHTEILPKRKVLVTIHGIRTHAEWNSEVTLLASANGWIVAPFYYGYVQPSVFASTAKRQEIVENFRSFLSDVTMITGCKWVSVLAHSFGTYVAMKYIDGWEYPPVIFDTVILTGAIISENYDFTSLNGKVAHLVNEIAPNDEWVEWAKIANLKRDPLFGGAGKNGFKYVGTRLTQHHSEIFSHTNVIKRDVIASRWLPALEANFGAAYEDAQLRLAEKIKNGL